MIYAEYVLICIAIPILLTLLYIRGDGRRYAAFFVIGMVTCILSAYVGGFAQQLSGRDGEWISIYVSPVIEEILKMMPLMFYLLLTDEINEKLLSSGVILAAGFATFENCCYILTAGATQLTYILIRGMAVGVMHIVSVMMLCIGLILVRRRISLSFAGIIGSLSFSITFHSLYNLLVSEEGISASIGYILPVATAFILYYPYRRLLVSSEMKGTEIEEA